MFIMSEKKAEDRELDELLKKMPKFTDKRSKEEIYQQLKSKIDMQEKLEQRNRMQVSMNKWLPFIISVASVLLLTVLVSSYINNNESITSGYCRRIDHVRRSNENCRSTRGILYGCERRICWYDSYV